MNSDEMLNERFDLDDDARPVVELAHPTAVFIDERELADQGATVDHVARSGDARETQVAREGVVPPEGPETDLASPWAFPPTS